MLRQVFIVCVAVLGLAAASPIISEADQLAQTFRQPAANTLLRQPQVATTTTGSRNGPINFPTLRALPALRAPMPSPVPATPVPATVAPVALEPTVQETANSIVEEVPIEVADTRKELEAEQAKNAHYSFDTSVMDTINGHSHTRQETRDGLSLRGSYSYSDGFFQRTVYYAADEGGYRVTKEEITPIGDGPRYNPLGTADVSSSLTGSYSITANDFKTSTTAPALEQPATEDAGQH